MSRSDGGSESAGWSMCYPEQAWDLFLHSVWLRGQWQAAPCVPRWSQTSGDPRVPVWPMPKVLPHQKCSSYPQVPVPSATVVTYCSFWFSNKFCENFRWVCDIQRTGFGYRNILHDYSSRQWNIPVPYVWLPKQNQTEPAVPHWVKTCQQSGSHLSDL